MNLAPKSMKLEKLEKKKPTKVRILLCIANPYFHCTFVFYLELQQLQKSVSDKKDEVKQMEAELERLKQHTEQQLARKTNDYKRKYSSNKDSP